MFSEQERDVFEYELPRHGKRYADPMRVRRELLRATGGQLNATLDRLSELDRMAREQLAEHGRCQPALEVERGDAESTLVDAVHAAFGVGPIDPDTGAGVTDAEAMALLDAYLAYEVKKNASTGNWPTSPTATACPLDGP